MLKNTVFLVAWWRSTLKKKDSRIMKTFDDLSPLDMEASQEVNQDDSEAKNQFRGFSKVSRRFGGCFWLFLMLFLAVFDVVFGCFLLCCFFNVCS